MKHAIEAETRRRRREEQLHCAAECADALDDTLAKLKDGGIRHRRLLGVRFALR